MADYKTISATGLSISRSGGTFTCSWKIGDADYGAGQWIRYQVNNGPIQGPVKIGNSDTSYAITIGTGIVQVAFLIQGKRKEFKKTVKKKTTTYKPSKSDWAVVGWGATIPAAPSISYSRTANNEGTFSWSFSPNDTGTDIFYNVEMQTCVSSNNDNPPGYGWSAATVGASGSVSYTEELTSGNLIRWVRVRSWGPAGASGWSTAYHAYGNPATPMLDGVSASPVGTYTQVTANWRGPFQLYDPIDTITLQYAIAMPTDSALSAPSSGWSDSVSVGANGGSDRIVVSIPDSTDTDECMWVRLKATHDGFHTFSNARLAYIGTLDAPDINATPNVTTGKVAISITENTDCTVAGTVIFYRSEKRPYYDQVVAVLERRTTSVTVEIDEIKTSYPGHVEHTTFGAYAYVGSHNGLSVNALMKSPAGIDNDILARPPEWLELSAGTREDSVRIKWPWTWKSATSAELSWADHEDAWESTDEPSIYGIDNEEIGSWIIAKLDVGKRWYFRVRLISTEDNDEIIGPWSDTYDYDLSSIPDKPILTLSKNVIDADGSVTARWAYASADGTAQHYADICIATISDDTITYGDVIAHVSENQTVEIANNWTTGTTYLLCLKVTSSAGRQSEWSDPVSLFIAPPVSINVTQNSLTTVSGELFLTEMPLTVTITGAGVAGRTIASIIRAEEYHIYRPDDSEFDGFEGESIATYSQIGESQITITTDDLVGALDDGATYKLICTVIDEYEQVASYEYLFKVAWSHQAGKPSATVQVDKWQRIAIITPIAPSNYASGDVCDIYRISSDKPELILKGAAFGTTYVDPYPAFGGHCGHRIVTRTANGDYITESNELAWFLADEDIGDVLEEKRMIIDVAGEQIELPYNIELQNSWNKDFKRTTYLGGSVKGDWNPAVTRDLSANTVILRSRDLDTQLAMRDLAGYAGPAHIRTPDGSSMSCDIQVRENWTYQSKRVTYSLTIRVIDPQAPDGMTYEAWKDLNPAG